MPRKRRQPTHVPLPTASVVLQRDSAIPLYHQLAVYLEGEVASGKFKPGERYYSDRSLVEGFGLSLLTIRQAVNELVEKHLLKRERGSGTFVVKDAGILAGQVSGVTRLALLFTGWRFEALSGWDAMYFRDIFEGIRSEAQARGYVLLIDDFSQTTSDQVLEEIRRRQIRGVIALESSEVQSRAVLYATAGLKVVAVNCSIGDLPSVGPNNILGVRLAVTHLLSLGHRRFVHLNSGEKTVHWREVERGYQQTLKDIDLPLDTNPVITSDLGCGSIDAGYECMHKALRFVPGLTAVVAGNDLMAIGALRCLRDERIAVPAQVSVIGFDDIAACEICEPALTTIHVDRAELGRMAVRHLLSDQVERSSVHNVTLVIRRSTAAAPV